MPSPNRCDWCGKGDHETRQLIVGGGQSPPRERYVRPKPRLPESCICDECVELLATVVAMEHPEWRDQLIAKLAELAVPSEPNSN